MDGRDRLSRCFSPGLRDVGGGGRGLPTRREALDSTSYGREDAYGGTYDNYQSSDFGPSLYEDACASGGRGYRDALYRPECRYHTYEPAYEDRNRGRPSGWDAKPRSDRQRHTVRYGGSRFDDIAPSDSISSVDFNRGRERRGRYYDDQPYSPPQRPRSRPARTPGEVEARQRLADRLDRAIRPDNPFAPGGCDCPDCSAGLDGGLYVVADDCCCCPFCYPRGGY